MYGQAQEALNASRFEDAKKIYLQAYNNNKKDPVAQAGLITSISLQGNQTGKENETLSEAQPYIDASLQSNPDDPQVLIADGYAYETAGDYQKALELYDRATKIDPKSANAWFHLGHVLLFLGKNGDAQKDFDKSIALDPNNPQSLMMMGNTLITEGKAEESFQSFKKASEQPNISNETKADALAAAATVRRGQDNFKHMTESLALSKQAVDAAPTFSPALSTYGSNLIAIGKTDEGIEYLKKAVAANPRIAKNYYFIGNTYRIKKDYENAISYIKQAFDTALGDNTVFSENERNIDKAFYEYQLAQVYFSSGSNIDTSSMLSDAVKLDPTLAQRLQKDYTLLGYFKNDSSNPVFLNLIK